MNADERALPEDLFTALLAQGDDAFAEGNTTFPLADTGESAELRPRLQRELAWCQIVRQLLKPTATVSPGSTSPRTPLQEPAPPPTHLGRFEICRELGRGSFGIVFLAYDPRLRREVALKVPRAEVLFTDDLRSRFRLEARTAAGLAHPNLVPVYEAGEAEGVSYIASAYCPGVTLATWLKQRSEPVPANDAARLLATLADAVDHAHRHGVLHRDLKPSNILLDDTHEPKVTDFGLAKLVGGDASAGAATHSGAIIGTPNYMAPEQASGQRRDIGPAADVYSLGAILYEVLTGRPPLLADTPLDTLLLVRTVEPLAPSRLRPSLPRDLDIICLKCLEKVPARRYDSAAALRDDLRRLLAGEPIQARPASAGERVLKWARRSPARAALVAVSVVGPVLVLAVILAYNVRLQQQRNLADARRQQALANLGKAREAVDRLLTRVSEVQIRDVPQMEGVRLGLLEDALEFYRGLLPQAGDDPEVIVETAQALRRLGIFYASMARPERTDECHREALALLEGQPTGFLDIPARRRLVARLHNDRSQTLRDLRRLPEAEQEMGIAKEWQERLIADFPDEPDYRFDLAHTLGQEALRLNQAARPFDDVEPLLRRSINLFDGAIAARPKEASYRAPRAQTVHNLAALLEVANRSREAEDLYRKNVAAWAALLVDEPTNGHYRSRLSLTHSGLGELHSKAGRWSEAEADYRRAVELTARLAEAHPSIPHQRFAHAYKLRDLAKVLAQRGETKEAYSSLEKGLQEIQAALRLVPGNKEYLAVLGQLEHSLAEIRGKSKE